MKRAAKEAFVEDFRSRIQEASVVYLTDFTGLDVKSMTVLRDELRKSGAEYVVVKNRLAKLALQDVDDYPDLSEALTGPTGVIFGYGGAVEPAKAVSDFAKEHEDKPRFKVGVLERSLLEPQEISRLADLPPREELLSELLGSMQSPLVALATFMQAKVQELSGLLEALKQDKEKE